ncbi:MAG: carbohydrate-binding family 9-like protein [Ginsengibacter sp.]
MGLKSSLGDSAYDNNSLPDTTLVVRSCKDFQITGKGDNVQWRKIVWTNLQKLDAGGKNYKSQFKILYSPIGIYVLFNGEDKKITSTFKKDFDKIFKADVFEVFFHTDPSEPIYFEYEISPLNKELVLLMINKNEIISGWAPWPYEKERKVQKLIHISGGEMEPGSTIESWTAELFFSYNLLSPFQNTPPVKGTRWNANFCRLDYDSGSMIKWAWAPVNNSFHELDCYYSLLFG